MPSMANGHGEHEVAGQTEMALITPSKCRLTASLIAGKMGAKPPSTDAPVRYMDPAY
jgi:hypothetical protein